ncbi:MAG: amidohydrolase family protein [Terriglobia bacterium]
MQIVDTHQHLWDTDLFPYTWCKGDPVLDRPFRLPDYDEAVRGLDVVKTVHLECDVDEPHMLDETRHILSLAEQPNRLAGVVACCRPENSDFEDYVNNIAGHPKLKGLRRVLHTQPDDLASQPLFIRHIRSLERWGLSFDICAFTQQLPVVINLVRECPGVSFILDHCGVPRVKEKELDPWREYIEQISRFPNVVCKVSGLVAYADPQHWTQEDLRPYMEHVIACFGWDRVMFGSDWPVCTLASPLRGWVETLESLVSSQPETNRTKLFHDNAIRVYRLN